MIPFNKPYLTGQEANYLQQACHLGKFSGDGPFTKACHAWIEQKTGCDKALLTHSCTAALEMAAILADIQPGDEIIMPSYTFVSTANAFVLRGGVPVFIDIREDTLNLDETLIEAAITPKTKAIVPVHYAGVACEMDVIMDIATRHHLWVIEDAAQGVMSSYKGRALGTIGHMGCYSFHETKNIICGEGGALLINDPNLIQRAEIIREKGTNRSRFLRGDVDKYTWCDLGSSYLPGELTAAFLLAQLEHADDITQQRLQRWAYYHRLFQDQRIATMPEACQHNAHMFYVLTRSLDERTRVMEDLKRASIQTAFHYVPLHSSPAGQIYGRTHGTLNNTNRLSERVLRLPLWVGLPENQQTKLFEVFCESTSLTHA